MANVRVRIAPAPSGSIHVGSARTALYNWLFARRHGGAFVVRIEDTDQKRVLQEAYAAVLEDLRWLGLEWDEGPEVGGDFAPYLQSERLDRYVGAAEHLRALGRAYPCYCTPEELAARRTSARAAGRPPGYDGHCRDLSAGPRAAYEAEGRTFAVRFRVPDKRTVTFHDTVRGTIATETTQIPDFVILRSDGTPTYMLAATTDDVAMDITHVIRGEDLLPATPRQLLLREAMGVSKVPAFAHLPLLVGPDRRPLSKRWGDVAVGAYRERGFLPEAMVNYLALLGWSYDDRTTIFQLDELIERFSLERVARNPATFDVTKLEWLNGHYIKHKSAAELADALVPFCVGAGIRIEGQDARATLAAVAPLLVERLKRLAEAPPMVRFLFEEVIPDERAAAALLGQGAYLAQVASTLEGLDQWTAAAIEEALRSLAVSLDLKPKKAFQPIRAAVTGTLVSPPLFESLEILGKDRTLRRVRAAAAQ
jgi:glutamyl-tRNA synthetase